MFEDIRDAQAPAGVDVAGPKAGGAMPATFAAIDSIQKTVASTGVSAQEIWDAATPEQRLQMQEGR
jgi:hypothetical protein